MTVPICWQCKKEPAVCLGSYEDSSIGFACDSCCGHGCADSHCVPLEDIPNQIEQMSARLSQVREQLRNADAKHLNWYRELVEAQRAHRQAADELTVLRNKVFPLIEAARVQTRHWEEMGFVCHDHLEAVASAIDTYLETL